MNLNSLFSSGWMVTALAIIGALRVVFKPVMTMVEAYVRSTPGREDDDLLEEVEHSRGYKVFCWALDFVASIKIGPQVLAAQAKAMAMDMVAAEQTPRDPRVVSAMEEEFNAKSAKDAKAQSGFAVGDLLFGLFGLIGFAALVGLVALLCGCQVLDAVARKTTAPGSVASVTNVVREVTTNFVPVLVQGPERVTTNVVERVTTNWVSEVRYVTNFLVKPEIAGGVTVAQAGASLAPAPYNAVAIGGLSVVSGVLGLLAAWKTKQSAQLAGDNDALAAAHNSVATQLNAVVAGVENSVTAAGANPDEVKKVKVSIEKASSALGVALQLDSTVQRIAG